MEKYTPVVFVVFCRPLPCLHALVVSSVVSVYLCIGGPNCNVQVGVPMDGVCASLGLGFRRLIWNVGALDG